MDRVLCILQAYAAQIVLDCDKCNEEFLRKFLEAHALYRAVIIATNEGCDQTKIDNVTKTLENYVLTMECRYCGNC